MNQRRKEAGGGTEGGDESSQDEEFYKLRWCGTTKTSKVFVKQ
jgi:hypothetical protein